jgi:hypothetical protein
VPTIKTAPKSSTAVSAHGPKHRLLPQILSARRRSAPTSLTGRPPVSADAVVVAGGSFVFSRCFGPESTQHAVYSHCAQPQVTAVLDGLDACVFAFGQTGAGKSYSMIGPEGGSRQDGETAGILPLAATEIFCTVARLETEEAGSAYRLSATFIEVHREGVFDLLSSARAKVVVRDSTEGAFVEGATSMRVRSTAGLLRAVARGSARRWTAETGVHAHSSRSHAILSLTLEKRWRTGHAVAGGHRVQCRTSTLRLVDLAGSEGLGAWSAHGDTAADGVATNLSLHVLGRCICALAHGEAHVPFRDSTLTRLLRPALAGRCQTQMLACVSPAAADAAESVSDPRALTPWDPTLTPHGTPPSRPMGPRREHARPTALTQRTHPPRAIRARFSPPSVRTVCATGARATLRSGRAAARRPSNPTAHTRGRARPYGR